LVFKDSFTFARILTDRDNFFHGFYIIVKGKRVVKNDTETLSIFHCRNCTRVTVESVLNKILCWI